MITDHEWNIIAKKVFPVKSVKAPDFLWTRILSLIEAEEKKRESSLWMQWRWMLRLTFAVGFFAIGGSYYLFDHSTLPLDSALEGVSLQQNAIALATHVDVPPNETPDLVVEVDS